MSVIEVLLLLLVAGVCGAIGQSLGGNARGGLLAAIALGFIGALLGTWLAGELGLPEIVVVTVGGKALPIVWSIIGAALFVAVLGLISGRGRRA